VAGANAFANGGGSTTCCGDVSGDTAEVIWTLSTTRTQYNAGMRLEKRNMTLPLPKREWGEDFLHVHFLPGNKVLPLADLPVAPFFICMATVIHRGDLVRTLISGVIVMITVLLIATQFAPYFTEMALKG
ncbi:PTS transporter subunit IIC, partial [Escherichia coli]|uniref:PTS transporter subunit IIC n=1 Tax=Escherichia coli TaxID=562 RepID=UPI0025463DD1